MRQKWFFVGLVSFGLGFFLWQNSPKKAVLSESVEVAPVASEIPSPSPSPAATPQPLVGYCLNVPTLLYHHIESKDSAEANGHKNIYTDSGYFEQQMAYLKNSGYTTLTISQVASALSEKQELPAKSIALTFDDGYDDFYTNAYPVLQKYGLVANVMLPTGLMDNVGYLKWSELTSMVSSGLVFPYNHTWSHASLANKSPDKVSFEILTAREQLVSRFGANGSDIFVYPYGSNNSQVVQFLRENGFTTGLSTIPGHVQCDSFLMTLHRNRVGNTSLSSYGL